MPLSSLGKRFSFDEGEGSGTYVPAQGRTKERGSEPDLCSRGLSIEDLLRFPGGKKFRSSRKFRRKEKDARVNPCVFCFVRGLSLG